MDNFNLASFDYHLPEELIAQQPAAKRDQSRLMALLCTEKHREHLQFDDITRLLNSGDLLIVNNTKVFPARLFGHKETGGKVEMLLLSFPENLDCSDTISQAKGLALIKSSKRPKPGSMLHFDNKLTARVDTLRDDGKVELTLQYSARESLEKLFETLGQIPLPPYIKRPKGSTREDSKRYQTNYAQHTGSVAAPTAGLHFSKKLLTAIKQKNVQMAEVTLHVGYGTFAPVRCNDIREHQIHQEYVTVSAATAQAVNATKAAGGRIWSVGTTTARTLEFAADASGQVQPTEDFCGLYIYPGYQFKVVENLITNFHLPQSSLLFLVAALAGKEFILESYLEAVRKKYRFFSYGDAMAIITQP
jgi:S-adenosylmethionine:tRNA ribosyltransferase-isomerase